MDAMRIAVSGIQAANMQLSAAASSIVNMDSSDAAASDASGGMSQPSPPGPPASYTNITLPHADLATAIVNLDQAAIGFKANLAVLRTASSMYRSLLNTLA